jgi:Methylase-associated X1
MDYRAYSVSRRDKTPLLDFMLRALESCGCRVLHHSGAEEAPFRITFEAPDGERIGIIAYAFFANRRATRNRPEDEHRFQVKYGPKTGELHPLWQDPFELYTTVFLGINPEMGFFVGADPVLHSPTRFFISVEFKDEQVEAVLSSGWHAWERQKRLQSGLEEPVEIMVGGVPESFLGYVRFERAAKGLESGHRALLADKIADLGHIQVSSGIGTDGPFSHSADLHRLAAEFQLSQTEILDLIQSAPRLKMAVRGWVAEAHLVRQLAELPGVTDCVRLEEDGRPDVRIVLREQRPLLIECKNILRSTYADGSFRLDFQRTRASKSDPCSRYYAQEEFDLVAACLHPRTERWEFRYALTADLDPHDKCQGRLSNRARLDGRWSDDPLNAIQRALVV